MKRVLKVSEQAEADLLEIWSFVGQRDMAAADKLIAEITNRFSKLLEFPEMGRARNDLILYLRSLAVGNYIIFYQPAADGIEILRVLHTSRDISSVFDDMVGE